MPALFQSVPERDYCEFFEEGNLDGGKVVDFLNYKKKDVSSATGVPIRSIRYDLKIPAELHERLLEWATAINLVAGYFNNIEKTVLWFQIPNPLLGNISPREMIRFGRFKKLFKFIQSTINENTR